jgi:hypothetical protein
MENQKVYEIINLEKKIDRNKAATIVSTSLLVLITGLELGVTLTCAYQHNLVGAIFNAVVTSLAGGATVAGYKIMSNGTKKMKEELKILKRQAGINENR